MRITLDIAESVAAQLCADRKATIAEKKKQLSDYCTAIYLRHLPDSIIKGYKAKPGYFRTTSSVRINGTGLGYEFYNLDGNQPTDHNTTIRATDEESDFIVQASAKIQELQTQYNEIKQQIEVALYGLRTYKNVEQQFPEAFALLPVAKVNTALIVNIADVRNRLAC